MLASCCFLRINRSTKGFGHSSRAELAGDLSECGDHDWGILSQSLSGPRQEEGRPDHNWLWAGVPQLHPEEGNQSFSSPSNKKKAHIFHLIHLLKFFFFF